mgnify:CR=1 FL=1
MLKASRAILPRLRNLFITTEVTPNPNALKFVPGRDVLGAGATCDFPDIREAYKSPLAKRIFAVDGVKGKKKISRFKITALDRFRS